MKNLSRGRREPCGKVAQESSSQRRWRPLAPAWSRAALSQRRRSTGNQDSTSSCASGSPGTSISSAADSMAQEEEEEVMTCLPPTLIAGNCNGADLDSPNSAVTQALSEVWLHVHDTNPLAGRLNELILRRANFGAFHSGVEVLGVEWSFQGFHGAWDDPTISGVVWNEPRLHPSFPYRESVAMGQTPLSREAISKMLDRLRREWSASSYHLVPKGISQRRLPMTWRLRNLCQPGSVAHPTCAACHVWVRWQAVAGIFPNGGHVDTPGMMMSFTPRLWQLPSQCERSDDRLKPVFSGRLHPTCPTRACAIFSEQ